MIWLTSDPHFGHRPIALMRGFASVEEHDAALLANYRACFEERDEIWWLGDIAFDGWRERLPRTVGTLPGHHHLVLGNHDRPHPLNSRGQDYLRDWMETFETVGLAGRISIYGVGFMLSHFPYSGDNADKEERETAWRLRDEGRILIHGHTHSAEQLTYSEKGSVQVHVGVDAWDMMPVMLSEAEKLTRGVRKL